MTESTTDLEPGFRKAGPTAIVLTAGGLAAAFGAAACCALPLLLAGAGLGTAWLGGIGPIAAPHRPLLTLLAAALLVAGGTLLWSQRRAAGACSVEGVCAKPTYRIATLIGLIIGATLLALGFVYG